MSQTGNNKTMRTITLEEHYATPAFMDGPGRDLKERAQKIHANSRLAAGIAHLIDQLCDLDSGRLAEMDAAGIDMQVLSLTAPGVEQLAASEAKALAHDTNDALAEALRRHPTRFAGFAALPTAAPDAAADELERTVSNYGFKGAIINGHIGGRYLDDAFFWPILERAEAFRVPLYIHPTPPPQAVIAASYTGNFPIEVTLGLASAAWGWHIETAIHVLRLVVSGAFDRYPNLQVIIGHMGETLPFMQQRLEHALAPQITRLNRPVSDYLRENLHYTFSGFNYPALFDLLVSQVGVERIMFSADYPFSAMSEALGFLNQLPVNGDDRERIAHGNAERLLRL